MENGIDVDELTADDKSKIDLFLTMLEKRSQIHGLPYPFMPPYQPSGIMVRSTNNDTKTNNLPLLLIRNI